MGAPHSIYKLKNIISAICADVEYLEPLRWPAMDNSDHAITILTQFCGETQVLQSQVWPMKPYLTNMTADDRITPQSSIVGVPDARNPGQRSRARGWSGNETLSVNQGHE